LIFVCGFWVRRSGTHQRDKDSVIEKAKKFPDVLLADSDKQNVFCDTSSVNLNVDVEDEDAVMQVMLKSIQDPDLVPIYEDLPDLGLVFVVSGVSNIIFRIY
jgi:hypothetical protein